MMKIRDLLKRKGSGVLTASAGMSVAQVVQMMMRHNIGAVPVVSGGGALVGIVSERDLVRALQLSSSRVQDLAVEQVMERELPTCDAGSSLHELMLRMTRERLRHILVLDEGQLGGIISVGDLVKHRLEELETETNILRDYVVASRAGT
jgi:CBS domain-containing protein